MNSNRINAFCTRTLCRVCMLFTNMIRKNVDWAWFALQHCYLYNCRFYLQHFHCQDIHSWRFGPIICPGEGNLAKPSWKNWNKHNCKFLFNVIFWPHHFHVCLKISGECYWKKLHNLSWASNFVSVRAITFTLCWNEQVKPGFTTYQPHPSNSWA